MWMLGRGSSNLGCLRVLPPRHTHALVSPAVSAKMNQSRSSPDRYFEREHDDEVERQRKTGYERWRAHVPLLYDSMLTYGLTWPSLTVQWIPDSMQLPFSDDTIKSDRASYQTHQLYCGTQTAGSSSDHILLMNARLPRDALATLSAINPSAASAVSPTDVDAPVEHRSMLMRDAWAREACARIAVVASMRHQQEVHRLRYVPGRPWLVASKGPSKVVPVYSMGSGDRVKDGIVLSLTGHDEEGWALSFCAAKPSMLASGSNDHKICVWDLEAGGASYLQATAPSNPSHPDASFNTCDKQDNSDGIVVVGAGDSASLAKIAKRQAGSKSLPVKQLLKPCSTFLWHKGVVEDVEWKPQTSNLFASVGDDGMLALWDLRAAQLQRPVASVHVHDAETNGVSFNPIRLDLIATGASDHRLRVWDCRKFGDSVCSPVYELRAHKDQVFVAKWAPFGNGNILASAGADSKVFIWDVDSVGQAQSIAEANEAPSEVLFIHGGHVSRVNELDWCPDRPFLLASVEDDNVLQVWSPSTGALGGHTSHAAQTMTGDFKHDMIIDFGGTMVTKRKRRGAATRPKASKVARKQRVKTCDGTSSEPQNSS